MKRIIVGILLLTLSVTVKAQDTIVVSIAHGSKPNRKLGETERVIGGKKGGHVVVQIDEHAYGFFFEGYWIHIFPHRKNKNSLFQKHTLKEWNLLTDGKKVTNVFIPVTPEEKEQLLAFYTVNLKSPSYDYSFFGQRCASSVYNELKSLHKLKGGSYLFNAFYPGELRKTILKQNDINNYKITVKEGSVKRKWEGD